MDPTKDPEAQPKANDGTVTVVSRARAAMTISLPHHLCCTDTNCHCSQGLHGSLRYNGRDGTRRVVGGHKRIAKAYTLLAGQTLAGLPRAVLRSPDLQAQKASLTVMELDEAATAKQADELAAQAKVDATTLEQHAKLRAEKHAMRMRGPAPAPAPGSPEPPGALAASPDAAALLAQGGVSVGSAKGKKIG